MGRRKLKIADCRLQIGHAVLACLVLGVPGICGRKAWRGKACRKPSTFTAADFERHVRELEKKLPGEGFTIVVAPPFVVIGDDPPAEVRRRAKENVEWAVKRLKEAYFSKDPDEILDIWLFKDKESYEKHAKSSVPHQARHALRLLLARRSGVGDEHRHRRRHAGPRDRAPLHGGQLSRVSGLVQRGARLALRAVRRRGRPDPRLHELASAGPARGDPQEAGCPRSRRSARRPPTSSTRRTAARTTPRPATCATTCNSKGCCGSSTAVSTPTGRRTRPATRPSKKSSAARTWRSSRRNGRPTC